MSDYLARRRARHEALGDPRYDAPWTWGEVPGPESEVEVVIKTRKGSRMWIVPADTGAADYIAHARNDEAATLDVLNAAADVRDWCAYDDGWGSQLSAVSDKALRDKLIRMFAALDALEGKREPLDGGA